MTAGAAVFLGLVRGGPRRRLAAPSGASPDPGSGAGAVAGGGPGRPAGARSVARRSLASGPAAPSLRRLGRPAGRGGGPAAGYRLGRRRLSLLVSCRRRPARRHWWPGPCPACGRRRRRRRRPGGHRRRPPRRGRPPRAGRGRRAHRPAGRRRRGPPIGRARWAPSWPGRWPGGRPRPAPGRRPRRPPRAGRRGHPAAGRRPDRLRALRRPARGRASSAWRTRSGPTAAGEPRRPPARSPSNCSSPWSAARSPPSASSPWPPSSPAPSGRCACEPPRARQGGSAQMLALYVHLSTYLAAAVGRDPGRRAGPGLGRVRPGPAGGGCGRPARRGLGHQVRPGRQAARRGHERHHRQGQVSVGPVRRRRGDGGQASVELALVLPLVVLLLLAVVQLGLLVRDQILVVHAAREAAREAAVDPAADAPGGPPWPAPPSPATASRVTTTGRGAPRQPGPGGSGLQARRRRAPPGGGRRRPHAQSVGHHASRTVVAQAAESHSQWGAGFGEQEKRASFSGPGHHSLVATCTKHLPGRSVTSTRARRSRGSSLTRGLETTCVRCNGSGRSLLVRPAHDGGAGAAGQSLSQTRRSRPVRRASSPPPRPAASTSTSSAPGSPSASRAR